MKKLIIAIATVMLILAFVGCGTEAVRVSYNVSKEATSPSKTKGMMNCALSPKWVTAYTKRTLSICPSGPHTSVRT